MKWMGYFLAVCVQVGFSLAQAADFSQIEVNDRRVEFEGEPYPFDQELIVNAFGERSQNFIGAGRLYECVLHSNIAKRISDSRVILIKMVRSQFSDSRGYLCRFTLSPSVFAIPISFKYFQLDLDDENRPVKVEALEVKKCGKIFHLNDLLKADLWTDSAIQLEKATHQVYSRQF